MPNEPKNNMNKKNKKEPNSKSMPHYTAVAIIAVLGILAYYNSIIKGIFIWDDFSLVVNNQFIKDFSHLKGIFTTHLFHAGKAYSNFYRPLQSLSFMLDYHFWKLNPIGYHLVNVVMHILNAILVYFLVWFVSKRKDAGLFTGILFCIHTVLSGPVNYIAARADLLCTMFFLISMNLYVAYKESHMQRRPYLMYIGSLLAFLFALLSKEMAFVIPFVFLFYLACFSDEKVRLVKSRPALIWVFLIVIAIYGYLRATVLNFSAGNMIETTTAGIPLYNRLLTTSKVIMVYFKLLLMPIGLHTEWYIEPARSFMQNEVFLSVVGLFIIGCFSWFLYSTSRVKLFFLGWFFIWLLPYSNIYPLPYFMGEGSLYIPSIGLFALLSMYLSEMSRKSKIWLYAVVSVVIFLTGFYGFLTVKDSQKWFDSIKFWSQTVKYAPKSYKANLELGTAYAKNGDYKNAEPYLKRALELNPKDHATHNNLGNVYKLTGQLGKAEEEYKKAIQLNPEHANSYGNLANIYFRMEKYEEAVANYKKAIELNQYMPEFYMNLGLLYHKRGMMQEARDSFDKVLQIDPGNQKAQELLKSVDKQ